MFRTLVAAFATRAHCWFMVNVVCTKTPDVVLQSCFPVIGPKPVLVHGVIPPQVSTWHSAIDPVKLLHIQIFKNWKTNHNNLGQKTMLCYSFHSSASVIHYLQSLFIQIVKFVSQAAELLWCISHPMGIYLLVIRKCLGFFFLLFFRRLCRCDWALILYQSLGTVHLALIKIKWEYAQEQLFLCTYEIELGPWYCSSDD